MDSFDFQFPMRLDFRVLALLVALVLGIAGGLAVWMARRRRN